MLAPGSANSCRMRTVSPGGRSTSAGFGDPSAGGPGGRADRRRHARGQSLQRAVSAGVDPAAGAHQDGQCRRVRRTPDRLAGGRGGGDESAGPPDFDGGSTGAATGDWQYVQDAVGGSARRRSRRVWTPISACCSVPTPTWTGIPPVACRCGASAFRPSFRTVSGISPASTSASVSSTRPFEREEFEEILHAAERWGLDDYMATRAFEDLALPVSA